ncbi:MAG: TonB-dependent receptor [Acidobacteria bacterium]|nr:TonB-dependent receptor [Acidobacteriota bacterium]
MITGAEVTATNVDTGVETRTTTNNAGVYNFASLQPGTYRVSAQAAGFQVRTVTDMRLRMGVAATQNFELAVAGTTTEVEVTGTSESVILEAGTSTGTVLQEQLVTELPLLDNDVMQLLNLMGGVVGSESPIFESYTQTFAGVPASGINITRDGVSVSEVRYTSGIVSPSRINPDMVGEMKMILSPVDAEMGRGAGQVQIMSRSGSNRFNGSATWNIQNTALDAREWDAKVNRPDDQPPWRNLHNYTVTASGPIVMNKTFFFVTWDHQMVLSKEEVRYPSMTPCARLGIFRYYEGWVGANAAAHSSFNDAPPLPTRPVVDEKGQPLSVYTNPATGIKTDPTPLVANNVMGVLTQNARAALDMDTINCSHYEKYVQDTYGKDTLFHDNLIVSPWSHPINNPSSPLDGFIPRATFDKSGYVKTFSGMVPPVNDYRLGDGLNVAAYRWTRPQKGANTVFGIGQDGNRKAVSTKIDHNINNEHRLSGTYNFEYLIGEDSMPSWDNEYAFGGNVVRKPQSFTIALTSTLRPTLLNEFRFGLSRTQTWLSSSLTANTEGLTKVLQDLLPEVDKRFVVPIGYDGVGYTYGYNFMGSPNGTSHPYGNMGILGGSWGGVDHRWTVSDTATWMKGAHSFKGGFELRLAKSRQDNWGSAGGFGTDSMFPAALGGTMSTSGYDGFEFFMNPDWPGLQGLPFVASFLSGSHGVVQNMLNWFSGSVGEIQQLFYTADPKARRWNSFVDGENMMINDIRNREFAFFFKDDWRVNNDLTLNLGVRYEYFGVPWENQGRTVRLIGGSKGLWGGCGATSFDNWMSTSPTDNCATGKLSQYQFVGPNSEHPDIGAWERDGNNIAPHVGFSWQLPWLGKGLTTLRAGYSISYTPITNFDGFRGIMSVIPDTQYSQRMGSSELLPYATLDDLKNLLPLKPPDDPVYGDNRVYVLGTRPVTQRSAVYNVYDDNIRNPYVQNFNMSVTRQVGNTLTVDVRYIGTLTRKQIGGVNLNAPNFINNGLFAAFAEARRTGNNDLINQLIPPGALMPNGFDPETGPIIYSGSYQLMNYFDLATFSGTNSDMATGNFSAVANTLATTNGAYVSVVPQGVRGAALRNSVSGSQWNGSPTPENLIYTNPQLTGDLYGQAGANLTANRLGSNYHSMQVQVTMRPVHGLSFQSTYTWSRNIARQGITDYRTMEHNYYLSSQHRSHTLNSYGTYELPLGAKGYVFRDVSGAFKKAVEGWQVSWILALTSGLPASISGGNTLWGDNRPVVVRPELWDNKAGKVTKGTGDDYMSYFFGDKYTRVIDTYACGPNYVHPDYASSCESSRKALAIVDPNGPDNLLMADYTQKKGWIVIQNAAPDGRDPIGSQKLGWNSLTGPGRWTLDMAMSKGVEFMEGKRIEIRVDAQNIFNHPTPSDSAFSWNARQTSISNPEFGLNGANPNTFGRLQTKAGHRTFQAKIRIQF